MIDEQIIKALLWVLRSALTHDRDAVLQFLEQNKDRLAAPITYSVKNKLDTNSENAK